ncbi:alanine racemase [Polynucleobacter sp. SHI8]|uniref:alanine racemase n=1 Tax=unclassified Polynucleobacter TaxID=2640945 RepID=UPI0024901F2B|nr:MULTISPECIES: alanine racemase [unclassified Polynucleobacter]BDW11077.1 alanine racemase [Polynucleobacter sp. SHI2]BDW13523.1 alanine racemase [Polynucleobacter sp. SHI8]
MKHRPTKASILTQNLSHNLLKVKKMTNSAPTWAVVKANAYGHGLKPALKAFQNSEGIALLDMEHAALARECGWQGRILLLEGIFTEGDLDDALNLSCEIVIHHEQQVTWLIQWFGRQSSGNVTQFLANCPLWLKLNSGMNRLGFKSAQYGVSYEILKQMGCTVHHLTHFANADDPQVSPSVKDQWEIFSKATQYVDGLKSAANSAAIIGHSFTHADMTRPGIMLYGASPSGKYEDIANLGLKAGMNLRSEIIAFQELQAGDTVGYGSQYQAKKNTKIAVIACGYADGYPRSAPNGTPVWIGKSENMMDGQIVPLVGRVSMDMMMVDVTNIAHAQIGSPIELWGELNPIDDVAFPAKTVGYELMCGLANRVRQEIL